MAIGFVRAAGWTVCDFALHCIPWSGGLQRRDELTRVERAQGVGLKWWH